jgi:tetratricopeptide (TPR) repeat protein
MSLLLPLLLLQAAAPSASSPPAAEPSDQRIIVTGRSMQATGAVLDQCLARRCPPAEEIAAAMTHAQNQLIAANLTGAHATLRRARDRNRDHARTLPVAVSGLLQFDAQVASLLGLANHGRIGMFDAVAALKAGLPADDPRIAAQRLLVGDVFLREGRYATAVKFYDAVAARAAASGWADLRGAAMFRALTFYAMAADQNPAYRAQARRRYDALRATTDPAMRPARDASRLLEARLLLRSGKAGAIDGVMRRIGAVRTGTPMLVMTPRIDLAATPATDEWADFSFRILPDGSVTEVQVTDRAAQAAGGWIGQVEKALAGRRYLPLDLPPGSDGLWRRERFLLVADFTAPSRSRIRDRSGPPQLRSIDLTPPLD